jgi:hypothetical protein
VLSVLIFVAAACWDRATIPDTPAPPETSERAHLFAIEVHKLSGEIVPLDPWTRTRPFCPLLECSVWVYVTAPGESQRTIFIDVPSTWILPPRTVSIAESQIPSGTAVKVYEGAFDTSQLQMADIMPLQVRLTETSSTWGTHIEEQTLDVSF